MLGESVVHILAEIGLESGFDWIFTIEIVTLYYTVWIIEQFIIEYSLKEQYVLIDYI